MTEVSVTDEFGEWYDQLSEAEQVSIRVVVAMLEQAGVTLPFPFSSNIESSEKYALRELRPKRGASPLRVFYAFDPAREAILILGGGKHDELYTTLLRQAEDIWTQYLVEFEARKSTSPDKR